MELSKCKIGIRPDHRRAAGAASAKVSEEQTMGMAKAAKALIEANRRIPTARRCRS